MWVSGVHSHTFGSVEYKVRRGSVGYSEKCESVECRMRNVGQ